MDVDARLDAIEAENEALRERVYALEALLRNHWMAPIEMGLTPKESMCLGFLLTKTMATKAEMMTALYSDRIDGGPEPKIVDVFICKLRPKIKRFGIVVETIWGQGYALSPSSKDKLRALTRSAESSAA